eukprot:COSAG04_NODE_2997_length_3295_cov_1.976846_5_plen_71_part_00
MTSIARVKKSLDMVDENQIYRTLDRYGPAASNRPPLRLAGAARAGARAGARAPAAAAAAPAGPAPSPRPH